MKLHHNTLLYYILFGQRPRTLLLGRNGPAESDLLNVKKPPVSGPDHKIPNFDYQVKVEEVAAVISYPTRASCRIAKYRGRMCGAAEMKLFFENSSRLLLACQPFGTLVFDSGAMLHKLRNK